MITVRKAGSLDARPMADLLNAIIQAGGSTALTDPVTADSLRSWMDSAPGQAAWHLAETDAGEVLGFQWIEPASYLPPEAAEIATFVQIGRTGLGIGSRLFDKTRQAALDLGYTWINANIRADNAGGLAYYQSRGFEDYTQWTDYRMGNGQLVDKRLKRFNLT